MSLLLVHLPNEGNPSYSDKYHTKLANLHDDDLEITECIDDYSNGILSTTDHYRSHMKLENRDTSLKIFTDNVCIKYALCLF